jgi:hypothetical protein
MFVPLLPIILCVGGGKADAVQRSAKVRLPAHKCLAGKCRGELASRGGAPNEAEIA